MAAAELVTGDGPISAPGEFTLLPLELELRTHLIVNHRVLWNKNHSLLRSIVIPLYSPIRGRRIGGQFQLSIGLLDRAEDVCNTERGRVQVVVMRVLLVLLLQMVVLGVVVECGWLGR